MSLDILVPDQILRHKIIFALSFEDLFGILLKTKNGFGVEENNHIWN